MGKYDFCHEIKRYQKGVGLVMQLIIMERKKI